MHKLGGGLLICLPRVRWVIHNFRDDLSPLCVCVFNIFVLLDAVGVDVVLAVVLKCRVQDVP